MMVILGIVMGIQVALAASVRAWTKVDEGPCTFKSWGERNGISLNLDCNGQEAWASDTRVIREYIKNPGPLTCSLWATGKATCQIPE